MIIQSILDTDFYKFTMQQIVFHRFNEVNVEYHFKCRTAGADLAALIPQIKTEIAKLSQISAQPDEIEFLKQQGIFKSGYLDWLKDYSFKTEYVSVEQLNETDIDIIVKGPWTQTILFEIPLLSIVNELYFSQLKIRENEGMERLEGKINQIKKLNESNFKFTDFGTRRRFSREWQDFVVQKLAFELPKNFIGTSNVYFAKKYNLKPIGTMAHEYLQACQVIGGNLKDFQKFALQEWADEYRGNVAVALTDVITFDVFLADFDKYFAKLYDGLRQDSGDPFVWGEKAIAHYEKLGINAKEKSLVFSDSLNVPKAIALFEQFKDRTNPMFGIGTNLTNDMGADALNIVIKMTSCNDSPVAKISDSNGKTMCKDDFYVEYIKQIFNVK